MKASMAETSIHFQSTALSMRRPRWWTRRLASLPVAGAYGLSGRFLVGVNAGSTPVKSALEMLKAKAKAAGDLARWNGVIRASRLRREA